MGSMNGTWRLRKARCRETRLFSRLHFRLALIVQEPLIGSPVLGAGGHCPKADEVLHIRAHTRCDIGAFESP